MTRVPLFLSAREAARADAPRSARTRARAGEGVADDRGDCERGAVLTEPKVIRDETGRPIWYHEGADRFAITEAGSVYVIFAHGRWLHTFLDEIVATVDAAREFVRSGEARRLLDIADASLELGGGDEPAAPVIA